MTLTVNYERSDEGTPVMCVAENNFLSISIIKMFTGAKAERLYKELIGQNVIAEVKSEEA